MPAYTEQIWYASVAAASTPPWGLRKEACSRKKRAIPPIRSGGNLPPWGLRIRLARRKARFYCVFGSLCGGLEAAAAFGNGDLFAEWRARSWRER